MFKSPATYYTNRSEVEVAFRVEDKGSGVVSQNSSCSLLDESTGIRSEQQSESCVSPISFNLSEGRYLFTLRSIDRAGLTNEKVLPPVPSEVKTVFRICPSLWISRLPRRRGNLNHLPMQISQPSSCFSSKGTTNQKRAPHRWRHTNADWISFLKPVQYALNP